MIVAEKNANVFDASEELLFVPVSTGEYRVPTSGFAKAVQDRYPVAGIWLRDRLRGSHLRPGEVHTFSGPRGWMPAYAIMFAGIHQPEEHGWEEASATIEIALYQAPVERLGRAARIAVAGIPGAGFSGLKGGADPEAIRHALERSDREVVIYHHDASGDRGPLSLVTPLPSIRGSISL